MTPDEARSVLGVTLNATLEQVQGAYLREVKLAHPDLGGGGTDFERLRMARDLLRIMITEGGAPCPNCLGKGCVPGRIGVTTCSRCNGDRTI